MYNGKKVIAIVTAGGKGKRMGSEVPKQFLKVGSETIIEKSAGAFLNHAWVDRVVVTVPPEDLEKAQSLLSNYEIITGGAERQDSVANALEYVMPQDEDIVLIHDGVRPYCDEAIIQRVIIAAEEFGAAICGIVSTDTLRHVEDGILDRDKVYRVQTPQGFTGAIIKEAYKKALGDGFYGTDESGLVERCGHKVAIVEGSAANIKITTPEDLDSNYRIGTGFDVHAFGELGEASSGDPEVVGKVRPLILGGANIPYEKGLIAHSDGDVLIHAIADALLGGAGLPDIGRLFSDKDPACEGMSGGSMLKQVSEKLDEKGLKVSNIDATIICQRPKLAQYIDEMKANIANALGIEPYQIGLKATTTEKLGIVGRGEGIACEAVCLLKEK